MMLSYVLDAGKGLTSSTASQRAFSAAALPGSKFAKNKDKALFTPEATPIARTASYAAEDADLILRLWRALKARMVAEKVTRVYETWSGRCRACWPAWRNAEFGRPGVLSHLSNDFGKKQAALERDINKIAGTQVNPGSPKQLGEPLRPDGITRRHQDQDRTVVDRRPNAGRIGRARPQASAGHSRLARCRNYVAPIPRRCRLRESENASRAHYVCALRQHRPAVSPSTQSAEHSDPHRGRTPDSPGLHRPAGMKLV